MLVSHINAIEEVLIAQSRTATNAGHPNLRGGPREWFIRDFLASHLPSTLEIGQGEIIDVNSQPNPPPGSYRPQVDVVVYRRDMPKISYSSTDSAYLVEGAMATIESKSVLTQAELDNACKATKVHKLLTRQPPSGVIVGAAPEEVISYVVAFDGPANMSTIGGWLVNYVQQNNVSPDKLVDMVVVLGKGVLWRLKSFPDLQINTANKNENWAFVDQSDKNLFTLFTHMLTWVATSSTPPNTVAYASKVQYQNVQVV
ncbi:MAG: hypothetical protein COC19_00700 [SAR86 cluster bacterium]|uniref:DUF6602 domain-containing protein n=1 Tax=SAR86 cluster bacterium TaxID=2030880 RepID=A0A2A4MV26_9GAMM|nr:MAG: hypothetical protein COC19_00700 [SAR86 cluster bacterium]